MLVRQFPSNTAAASCGYGLLGSTPCRKTAALKIAAERGGRIGYREEHAIEESAALVRGGRPFHVTNARE